MFCQICGTNTHVHVDCVFSKMSF